MNCLTCVFQQDIQSVLLQYQKMNSVGVSAMPRGQEENTKTVRIGRSIDWMKANYMPPRGINISVVTVPDLDHASDQTICKFITNALNPDFPRYREDIEQEISKLKCIEERIHSQKDWKKINNQKEGRTETIIDSVLEDLEDTPLDHQIKRVTQIQPAGNNKHLGRIWGKANQ